MPLKQTLQKSNNYCCSSISYIVYLRVTDLFIQIQTHILFPSGFELPRMNYDVNGKRHRFVYGNCVEESALSKQVTFLIVSNSAIAKVELGKTSVFVNSYSLISVICQERPETCRYL